MKSKLVIATSAIALAIGFGSAPAFATIPGGGNYGSPCCGVDWDFVGGDIDLNIQPDDFDLSGITSICAEQLFVGELDAEAIVKKAKVDGDLTNAATAAANMISVTGDTVNDVTKPSSFPAVVEAVQEAYGKLYATAEVGSNYYWWAPKMEVGGNLDNAATAAANIISLDVSGIGGVDATQKAGSFWNDLDLTATAEVSRVKVGGDLTNSATTAANIVSVSVTPTKLDAGHSMPSISNKPGNGGNNGSHDALTSLALVDVTQTAFVEMNATAKVSNVKVGGNLSNAATAAANVISVVNK